MEEMLRIVEQWLPNLPDWMKENVLEQVEFGYDIFKTPQNYLDNYSPDCGTCGFMGSINRCYTYTCMDHSLDGTSRR